MHQTILDSKKIEDYLRLTSNKENLSLVPIGANNIRVSNLNTASGGMTNNVYSFQLTFSTNRIERHFNLILKTYPKAIDLLFQTNRPNEDLRKYVREFQTLRSLENINFPVPHAYLCESDSTFLGYPFVIMQKEKALKQSVGNLDCFAKTLARLHNLDANLLGIQSIKIPQDRLVYAKEWLTYLKNVMTATRHYKCIKKDFEYAIHWLEMNYESNPCPRYSLIHGEYHPGHTIMAINNTMKVIDWEKVAIGDPAFDVGYAYHMVKLMYNAENPNSGEKAAEYFVSQYSKNFEGNVQPRLEFYKVIGILGVTIAVSSFMSKPLAAYRRFGPKTLARSLVFPFLPSNFLAKRWMNSDFIVSYLQYCQDFIKRTLK